MQGISTSAVVPMRVEANERSEMASQLLWGETFRVEERVGGWLRIHSNFDRYQAWVSERMVRTFEREAWEQLSAQPYQVCTGLCTAVSERTGEQQLIPHGSLLYHYNETTRTFALAEETYKLMQEMPAMPSNKVKGILQTAQSMINSPYLWGGRTILGVDCSGFTQLCYRLNSAILPRDACQQAEKGEVVDFITSAKPADLAFFDNEDGKIAHVGLILNEGKIIHASGRVRINKLDSEGIYSEELGKYTHKLRLIKRML
ncbi:MAG: C40 family peptidase [Prevotellaceae bacterium]|jgi:cell wall-associated NlpC family hydrolase|nr:C40 family peptidase [Prevotellaceae bacterium]